MATDINRLKTEVMSSLRAVLLTSKGGVPMDLVNKDYKALEYENIPYRKLGCSSLEEFLEQVPGLRIYRKAGAIFVETIPDEKTAGLADLINRTKSSKRKPSRMPKSRPMIGRFNGPSRGPPSPKKIVGNQRSYPSMGYGAKVPSSSQVKPMSHYPGSMMRGMNNPTKFTDISTRPTVTYPAAPVKTELKVTIYPGKSGTSVEASYPPKQTKDSTGIVYPGTSQAKSEPKVTTYPGQPTSNLRERPICEPKSVATSMGQPQQRPSNLENLRSKSPPQTTVRWESNGARSPETPKSGTSDCRTADPIRQFTHPVHSPTSNGSGRGPPPLKVMRSLSERLRNPDSELQNHIMTSPNVPATAPVVAYSLPLTPPPETDDPIQQLSALAKRLNFSEPMYTHVRHPTKSGRITVYSKVSVGPKCQHFSSYPNDAYTEQDASRLAARSALEALLSLHSPPIPMRITTDRDLIQKRILEIVDPHPSGVFEDKVPIYYMDKHGETLPQDWLQIARVCGLLSLEKGAVNSRVIISRAPVEVQMPNSAPEWPLKSPTTPLGRSSLLSSSTVSPVPLTVPTTSLLPVYVSEVFSPSSVWVRLLEDEYNEPFSTMCDALTSHYSTITTPSATVEVQNYYVTKIDGEAYRVRVEALDPLITDAEVFFIDNGDTAIISCCQLFPIAKQFLELPPQAIRAVLSGLDDIAACPTVTKAIEKHLLDKALYLEVIHREEDDVSPVVTGVFWDSASEIDVNVNEKIRLDLQKLMDEIRPQEQVAVKGKIIEVFVSHADTNDDVYLQVNNDGLVILSSMMNVFLDACFEDDNLIARAMVKSVEPGEMYLAQRLDNNWVRVQLAEPKGQGTLMRMVDFGGLIEVEMKRMLKLSELSVALATFPPQAVKVQLHNVGKWNERMASRLRELAGPKDKLLGKVVQVPMFPNPSVIELFKRLEPDNVLISINNTMDLESQINRSEDSNNNGRRRLGRRGSKDSEEGPRLLKPPKIPNAGEHFDVHVTEHVVSPNHFVVQPLEDKVKFQTLMMSLQESYKAAHGPRMMIDEMEKGRVYAVKNNQGMWHRACLNRVMGDETVRVHLCDFGNLSNITLSQIQPLKKEFFNLPYQAINAKLVGVQPISGDWSLLPCVRFQKLVANKDFVATVKRSEGDETTHAGINLVIDLIDVSTDKDIYIKQVLIDEKRARPKAD